MSDFAQAGLISTLQRLNEKHLAPLEVALEALAGVRPIALILPCHGADLESPALAHIVDELSRARFLSEIVVSMNGLDGAGWDRAQALFGRLPQRVSLLWNDGPMLKPVLSRWTTASGKGVNVWSAVGLLTSGGRAKIIATQDVDVASFRKDGLARLCTTCAHPELGYRFGRMYYSRVTDRLYGRVSRLFLAPLLQAFVRVAGHHPLLDFLLSFRYPLAGETVFTSEIAAALPFATRWSLEIAMLCELFRKTDPREVCQVDGGTGYDHRHHAMGDESALLAMSREIAGTLFSQLATEGQSVTATYRRSVAAAYRTEAASALRRSRDLALINGLPFDRQAEEALIDGAAKHLESQTGVEPIAPLLPSWASIARNDPSEYESFRSAGRTGK